MIVPHARRILREDGSALDTYDRRSPPDLENEASTWTHVVRCLPVGASVLDLGCWDGGLLALVRGRGAGRLLGIEKDRDAATRARARGLEVVEADLDDPDWPTVLRGERFDRVILADVVEHVRDPRTTLAAIVARVLGPGGQVVLSVPNVAHASVRLSLFVGDFDRTERGILDRTHLHFFTRRSLHALVRDAELAVASSAEVVFDVPVDVVRKTLLGAGVTPTPELEHALVEAADARAYQFVWSAARAEPGVPPAPPPLPSSGDTVRVVDRLLRAQATKIRRLEERIRVLTQASPFRFLRFAWLRWRQRRERKREERGS